MKTNRTKILSTTALIAVLCMQLFWMWNSFEMTVHQMGFETPWNLAPDVRAQALLAAFYESKFTVLTSLLTTVVIILSLIDQINYIDEQERVRLLREECYTAAATYVGLSVAVCIVFAAAGMWIGTTFRN